VSIRNCCRLLQPQKLRYQGTVAIEGPVPSSILPLPRDGPDGIGAGRVEGGDGDNARELLSPSPPTAVTPARVLRKRFVRVNQERMRKETEQCEAEYYVRGSEGGWSRRVRDVVAQGLVHGRYTVPDADP
jgi:hypothetical protein